jgi:hypothetical protein
MQKRSNWGLWLKYELSDFPFEVSAGLILGKNEIDTV